MTSNMRHKVNFYIPAFEGQIDVDVVEKWLILLEGNFSVHNFSDRETIIFSLLKDIPRAKYWWETSCEQKEIEGSTLFVVAHTWGSLRDGIKEQ